MSRYIDADKLCYYIQMERNPYGKPTIPYKSGVKVLRIIERQFNANVRENIKGNWIEIKTAFEKYKPAGCFSFELKKYTRKKYKCSNCDKTKQYKENFCPSCGADMREAK